MTILVTKCSIKNWDQNDPKLSVWEQRDPSTDRNSEQNGPSLSVWEQIGSIWIQIGTRNKIGLSY